MKRLAPLLFAFAACMPAAGGEGAAAPVGKTWTDPDGRFTIDVPGTPVPRDVQEITGVGTVNFKVYASSAGPYEYRVTAFAYPVAAGASFDAAGELAHACGRAVARMRGTIENEMDVTVDGVKGKEVYFTFATPEGRRGRGVQRMLVGVPAARYHAFCLVPAGSDLQPCEAFVRSLRPKAK